MISVLRQLSAYSSHSLTSNRDFAVRETSLVEPQVLTQYDILIVCLSRALYGKLPCTLSYDDHAEMEVAPNLTKSD